MNLQQWLAYIESVHYSEIEFGLDRVNSVYKRLFPQGVNYEVVIVAGTNGKGSCCNYLEGILLEAGYVVGKFTSPHIVHFNERIAVNAENALDVDLISAFKEIEACRGDTKLTYFEYSMLASIVLFSRQNVDIGVFEVGLGGRLDAVNILQPSVSVITSIGLDHTDWLGDDLSQIAKEKAGIARKDRPCVVGMVDQPDGLLDVLSDIGANTLVNGNDFELLVNKKSWSIQPIIDELELLTPNVDHQYTNASCAIVAAKQLDHQVTNQQIRHGLKKVRLTARCEVVNRKPLTIVDVAHNEDSVRGLAEFVNAQAYKGKCMAIFSMLSDKDILSSISYLTDIVDEWHLAEIKGVSRAAPLKRLELGLSERNAKAVYRYSSLSEAFNKVKTTATDDDCLLIFGSFHVVGELHDDILRHRFD